MLSSLPQVLTSFFPSIYMVEHLYINGFGHFSSYWQDDVEDMQWLENFQPFTSVKNLYVFKDLEHSIASALRLLVGERATYVLPADVSPALESLF
jgi:hypothetical protein